MSATASLAVFLLIRLVVTGDLGRINDDGGHIWDLLKVKLLGGVSYATFHTQLYTCAAEFDFLPVRQGNSFLSF